MLKFLPSPCIVFAISTLLLGAPNPLFAQKKYEKGPAPTIGDLLHTADLELPAPRTRTQIGVRETVKIKVDIASWNDDDYEITGSGQVTVKDKWDKNVVKWTPVGQGTVNPLTGDETTLLAAKKGGEVTVRASIDDSNKMGDDAPIEKQVTFTVVEPSGVEVYEQNDYTTGWEAGAANMAASTKFKLQITPKTVNFKNVDFRREYPFLTGDKITWPDGTEEEWKKSSEDFKVADVAPKNNVVELASYYPLRPIARLANQDPDFTFTVSYAFQFEGDTWSTFKTATSPRAYRGKTSGSLGKARVSFIGNNTLHGNWMGLWK